MSTSSNSSSAAYERLKSFDNLQRELLPYRPDIGCSHNIGESTSDCPIHRQSSRTHLLPSAPIPSTTSLPPPASQPSSAVRPHITLQSSLPSPTPLHIPAPIQPSVQLSYAIQSPTAARASFTPVPFVPASSSLNAKNLAALRIPAGLQASLNLSNRTAGPPFFRLSSDEEGRCVEYTPEKVPVSHGNPGSSSSLPVCRPRVVSTHVDAAAQMQLAYNEALLMSDHPAYPTQSTPATGQPTPIASERGRPTIRNSTRGRIARRRGASRGNGRGSARATARGAARGSTRGAVRGTAIGAARGAGSSSSRKIDPTLGWKVEAGQYHSAVTEDAFLNNFITQRVRLFVLYALQRLNLELEVKNLTSSRADVVVLFMDEVIRTCQCWLNEHVRMKDIEGMEVSLADMYHYLAVMLYSHCSGFSMNKVIATLQSDGGWPINRLVTSFIHNNLLVYSPTGRGDDMSFSWNPQRDCTAHLGEFERKAFRMSARVYLNPNHTFCTLDDDLMGTRAEDNPLVTISSRKADKEGHSMTAIADAIFRVFLHARFGRRGETKKEAVSKLLSDLLENRGERCLEGIVLTYDRGYASEAMVTAIVETGVACICIVNDKSIVNHPFAARSYYSLHYFDDFDEECDEHIASSVTHNAFDRHIDFIVDDSPDVGPGCYRAVKTVGRGQNAQRLTAVAVRQYGTKKPTNVVRFLHAVTSPVRNSLQHWVAVSHTWNLQEYLFNCRTDDDRILIRTELPENASLKERVEHMLLDSLKVLTVAQRCADWFTLREFRFTSTLAASILLKEAEYREVMRLPACDHSPLSSSEVLQGLSKKWFSVSRSTEDILRGTVNEDAVLRFFLREDYVKEIYKVGMVCNKLKPWLGCSADAVIVFDADICRQFEQIEDAGKELYIGVMEIKTLVGSETVGRGTQFASRDVIVCDMRTAAFQERVPKEHAAQLVHHCLTIDASWFFYVCASESQFLYTVLSTIPHDVTGIVEGIYTSKVAPALSWDHASPPEEAVRTNDEDTDRTMQSRYKFWRMINEEVLRRGPFIPVKIFKHGSQTIYNKTKGGVGRNAQMRAILRCYTETLKWEQKLVTQVFKSLAVNSWVAWRQLQKKDMLRTRESFRGLEQYRNSLNKVESLADFIFELTPELLSYAEKLDKEEENGLEQQQEREVRRLKKPEISRIIAKAKARTRYRLNFFNSSDGIALRLHVKGHDHFTGSDFYCALCGNNPTRKKTVLGDIEQGSFVRNVMSIFVLRRERVFVAPVGMCGIL